jgi:GH24 family phage-related lysozyme (muramidase)
MDLMKTSYKGLAMIRRFEGCKLQAYKPVPTEKYYTIGYGHYGPDVKQGMCITEKKAEDLLRSDVILIETELNSLGINFMQQQFDALVSWIYNLGTGNFRNSTMKKYIVADRPDYDITDQLVKWVKSNGKPLLGLMRRRVAEANMWLGGDIYRIENNKITRR